MFVLGIESKIGYLACALFTIHFSTLGKKELLFNPKGKVNFETMPYHCMKHFRGFGSLEKWLKFQIWLLLHSFNNRCDLSLFTTTPQRNQWCRRKKTERFMCYKVQAKRYNKKRKIIWNWYRERRRMWYLHGDEQQGCAAQLQPLVMYEMLQKLVSKLWFKCYIMVWISYCLPKPFANLSQ